jgi:hypothetical protein
MTDLFDEIVMCSGCGRRMTKVMVLKNGFQIRALQCEKCNKRIYHPEDIEEYKKFTQLKHRPFAVKLRMVGNSYTVSIPREIVDFMNEQEKMHDEMVKVFFEEFGKISLMFAQTTEIRKINGKGYENNKEYEEEKELKNRNQNHSPKIRIIKDEEED